MLKIGEFSKLSRVSVRMLRHYDEIGLLKPAEIDRFKGTSSRPHLNQFLRHPRDQITEGGVSGGWGLLQGRPT